MILQKSSTCRFQPPRKIRHAPQGCEPFDKIGKFNLLVKARLSLLSMALVSSQIPRNLTSLSGFYDSGIHDRRPNKACTLFIVLGERCWMVGAIRYAVCLIPLWSNQSTIWMTGLWQNLGIAVSSASLLSINEDNEKAFTWEVIAGWGCPILLMWSSIWSLKPYRPSEIDLSLCVSHNI